MSDPSITHMCNPWETFHRLWTAAASTPGYNKEDWKLLEQYVPGPPEKRGQSAADWALYEQSAEIHAAVQVCAFAAINYHQSCLDARTEDAQRELLSRLVRFFAEYDRGRDAQVWALNERVRDLLMQQCVHIPMVPDAKT